MNLLFVQPFSLSPDVVRGIRYKLYVLYDKIESFVKNIKDDPREHGVGVSIDTTVKKGNGLRMAQRHRPIDTTFKEKSGSPCSVVAMFVGL